MKLETTILETIQDSYAVGRAFMSHPSSSRSSRSSSPKKLSKRLLARTSGSIPDASHGTCRTYPCDDTLRATSPSRQIRLAGELPYPHHHLQYLRNRRQTNRSIALALQCSVVSCIAVRETRTIFRVSPNRRQSGREYSYACACAYACSSQTDGTLKTNPPRPEARYEVCGP